MPNSSVAPAAIEPMIVSLRSHRVILDSSLARMYGVEVRALIQAVKRNRERFPADFMFQLTGEEARARSRSQTVILNVQAGDVAASSGPERRAPRRGRHSKYLPYAFTEQGVAMLSSVLRSPRAIQVNIEVMRAFVRMRQLLASHSELAQKVAELEEKYDEQFRVVFDAIRELMEAPAPPERPIGFRTP